MPINVTSVTFADEFNTGTSTTLNGNVSDIITATINLEFSNIIDANLIAGAKFYGRSSDTISSIGYSNKQCFVLDDILTGANYNEYSSLIGAEIKVKDSGGSTLGTFTVLGLGSGTTIFQTSNVIICNEAPSLTGTYSTQKIVVTEPITDCEISYQFSGKNGQSNPAILLEDSTVNDGQRPTFKTTNSPLDATSGINTIPFKQVGSCQTGSMTIEGVGFSNDIQQFQIVHTVRATPIGIYNRGTQPSNFIASVLAIGNANATFENTGQSWYELNGFFSNQVTGGAKFPFEYKYTVGAIAPPKSKYGNSGATNYSISNLSIVRTSDSEPTSNPLIAAKFTVSFDINNTTNTPFSNSNTKVKVGIENLPNRIDNSENYEQTFLSDYAITTLGAGAVAGSATGDAASITNYTATFNSTSSVTVSFDVEFTSGAQTQINSYGKWFYIYTETQNHTLNYTNSDRVVLTVYNGIGIENILVDPIVINSTQFITAPYTDLSQAVSNANLDCFPVQLAVGVTRFYADWSGRDNLRIDTITQKIVVKNTSTLEEFEVEAASIPVNTFGLYDSKYPNASYSVGKGFKIPTTEVRNNIVMENELSLDSGDIHYFDLYFPFFIRWEDYTKLILNNTPTSIVDSAELNSGVNYDLYRYDTLTNWNVYYRLTFESSEGSSTFSQDFDYQLTMSDYNSHPDVTARELKLFKEDGVTTLINGGVNYVESTEKTLVQYEWTFSSPPSATTDFAIEFYLEAYRNGSPVKIQRISSENNLLTGSWFSSINGDGLVDKSISGSKAIGKAYIDDETLIKYDNYRLYATIYSPKSNESTLVTEAGEPFLTENNIDNLIIE